MRGITTVKRAMATAGKEPRGTITVWVRKKKAKAKDMGKDVGGKRKARANAASGDHATVGTTTNAKAKDRGKDVCGNSKAKAKTASGDHVTDAPKTRGKKAILDWSRLFDN